MSREEPGAGAQPEEQDDQAVLRYLGALETRRTAPEQLPQPDDAAEALAGADMMGAGDEVAGTGDPEGLQPTLGEWIPGAQDDLRRLEDDFVRAAPGYGERHNVTYDGWRAAGVSDEVLERAGIRPPEPAG